MSSDPIFSSNPYASHPQLSDTEAAVLWEYAKLSRLLALLVERTNTLSQQPDDLLLPRLRQLENKINLVLTMFKASVWGVINERNAIPAASLPSDSFATP